LFFTARMVARTRLMLRYTYIVCPVLISCSSAYVSQAHSFIQILTWNLCRSFSSLSLFCMSCPTYPLMILACFVKIKIMNIPSALRSLASCNFVSRSWTCFKPTDSSSHRLLQSSLCFMFSHQNFYTFLHSFLFATKSLNVLLFNLINRVLFCE
jgi:hypothetical protein